MPKPQNRLQYPLRLMGSPKFQRLIVALAMFTLIGGHRTLVQCYAWGKMIYERTSERSLGEAVTSTFSGEEPCEICRALRKANGKERNQEIVLTPKIELAAAPIEKQLFANRPLIAVYPAQAYFSNCPDGASPPKPPPRPADISFA